MIASHFALALGASAPAAFAGAATPTVGCDTSPEIFNTGIDLTTSPPSRLANNALDSGWEASQAQLPAGVVTLAANTARYPASSVPFAPAVVGKAAGAWVESSVPNANWISERRAAQSPGNTFYYRYIFTLDPRVEPSQFALELNFYADNSVPEVWVNAVPQSPYTATLPQATTTPFFYGGFRAGSRSTVSLAEGWQAGENEIMVQVASAPTHQGFYAEATAVMTCGPVAVDDERPPVDPGMSITPFDPISNDVRGSTPIAASSLTLDQSTSVGGSFTLSGGLVSFTADDLSFSGVASITYSVSDEGGLSDKATISVPVNPPDPSMSLKFSAAPLPEAAAKDSVFYSFDVTNTGNVPLHSVAVAVTAFSGTGIEPQIICPLDGASLAVAESMTCQASYILTQADVNAGYLSASAIATGVPPVGADVTATDTAQVTLSPSPGYTVSTVASTTLVSAGGTVTYIVTIRNTGTVDYTADNPASFTDELSDVLDDGSLDALPVGATLIGDVLRWEGPLAVTDTVALEYTVTVNDAADLGDGVLRSAVAPASTDGSCLQDRCATVTSVRAFTVAQTADTAVVNSGDLVTFTLEVVNTGSVPYTADAPATLVADLSAVVDDGAYNGDATRGGAFVAPYLEWQVGIGVGEVLTLTYSVTAGAEGSTDGHMTSVVLPDREFGGSCADVDACTTGTLMRSYSVHLDVDSIVSSPGQVLTYQIVLTNTGPADYTLASPAAFVADLAGVLDDAVYRHDASGGAVYGAEELTWRGALSAGDSVTITHTIEVNDRTTGDGDLVAVVSTPPDGSCLATTSTGVPDGCVSNSAIRERIAHTDAAPVFVSMLVSGGFVALVGIGLMLFQRWRAVNWTRGVM